MKNPHGTPPALNNFNNDNVVTKTEQSTNHLSSSGPNNPPDVCPVIPKDENKGITNPTGEKKSATIQPNQSSIIFKRVNNCGMKFTCKSFGQ